MANIFYLLIIFFIAFIFYLFIPGLGGILIRAHWVRFRRRLIDVSLYPLLKQTRLDLKKEGFLGNFRFFGTLEAIQEKNTIWITDQNYSVAANLENVSIYLLHSFNITEQDDNAEQVNQTIIEEGPTLLPWNQISSLPAGIQVFIGGSLYIEKGRHIYRSKSDEPLLVAIFDCNQKILLNISIQSGRQKNEYWNQFTPVSLITGSLILILLTYLFLQVPELYQISLFSLTLSLSPLSPLLPPGVIFYFLYRSMWKRVRNLRAERDLILLPLRYFTRQDLNKNQTITQLPDGEKYIMLKYKAKGKSPVLPSNREVKLRNCSILGKNLQLLKEYFIFGGYDKKNNNIQKPQDPMAELICIPGHPEQLAKRCNQRILILSFVSAFLIFLAVSINLFLILYILRFLLNNFF